MVNPRRIRLRAARWLAEAWGAEVRRRIVRGGVDVPAEVRLRESLSWMGGPVLAALTMLLSDSADWTEGADGVLRHELRGGHVAFDPAACVLEIVAREPTEVPDEVVSGEVGDVVEAEGAGVYYDDGWPGRSEQDARRAAAESALAEAEARLEQARRELAESDEAVRRQAEQEAAALASAALDQARDKRAEILDLIGVEGRAVFGQALGDAYRDVLVAYARTRGARDIRCAESGGVLEIEFTTPDQGFGEASGVRTTFRYRPDDGEVELFQVEDLRARRSYDDDLRLDRAAADLARFIESGAGTYEVDAAPWRSQSPWAVGTEQRWGIVSYAEDIAPDDSRRRDSAGFRLLADVDGSLEAEEVLVITRIAVAGNVRAQYEGAVFAADPGAAFQILADWCGFSPIDQTQAVLMLGAGGMTPSIAFRFAVLPGRDHWISLTAVQGNRHLDTVKIERFTGRDRTVGTGRVQARFDLFLKVDANGSLAVVSPAIEDDLLIKNLGSIRLPAEARGDLDRKVTSLWSREWNDATQVDEELERLGRAVAAALPDQLLHHLAVNPGPLTVLIEHAHDCDFPFELAYLADAGTGPRFLGERHRIIRALPTSARPPATLRVARVASIRNSDVLASSHSELSGLVHLLESLCERVQPVTTLSDLRSRVLRTSDYDVLDFVAHISVDSSRRSGLELEEGHFNAHEALIAAEHEFLKRKPFVFVNGCSATRESRGIFQSTSFPQYFLDLGASCFIGSSVPVLVRDALRFAQALYTELSNDADIAEATRQARIRLSSHHCQGLSGQDDVGLHLRRLSGLSYVVFGHPATTMRFVRAAQEGEANCQTTPAPGS